MLILGLALLLVITTSQPSFSQSPICAGDCDNNGVVRINELIRLVKAVQAISCPIAPNCPPPDSCLGIDIDGDGLISASELVLSVNRLVEAVGNSLNGCP